jgi:HK97 family phage major capsid protein
VPEGIDDIMDEMHTLADAAGVRTLTDAEATRFERLESALAAARRSENIRRRQEGYETPVPGDLPALIGVHTNRRDDTYNAAFNHYLRTGQPNADLVNAQGVGTDPAGGYLVSPQFRARLVEVMKAYGGLAAVVDSFTTERGGDVEYPSVDDTASVGAITAEAAAFTTGTDLAFGTIPLKAYKYTSTGADASAGMRVSWELLQDSEFDVEALIARALGTRIARKQAVDWTVGTGTGMPFGISHAGLTADVVLAAGNAITYQKLLDIESALDPAYEQNAQWCFNKAAWQKIRAVVDTTGRPLVDPQTSSSIGGRPARELLGYPVTIDQGMGNPATLSQRWGVLGDLQEAYTIRRVADFSLVVNPYSRAIFAQTEYSAWARADGNIQNRKAYALVQNNAA